MIIAHLEVRAHVVGRNLCQMPQAGAVGLHFDHLIDKLTITYNRSRQAMITKELIEIISGAEAV